MNTKLLIPVRAPIPHGWRAGRLRWFAPPTLLIALAVLPAWGVNFLPDTYRWNDPADGSYTDAANWTSNFGLSGVPDSSNENALFNLDGSYTVYFFSDISTASASLTNGEVAWSLNAGGDPHTYTLASLSIDPLETGGNPSLTITDGTVTTPQLSVQNGGQLLVTSTANLPSDGTFTVTGSGSTWTRDGDGLTVGQDVDGELNISDGATVSSGGGDIGFGAFGLVV